MDQPTISLKYNLPQLALRLANQPIKVLEWGRGTGKSTAISDEMQDMSYNMPRGLFFLYGSSFQQILTRTLPSTIDGLRMLGYHEGIHYYIGKKGKDYPMPYKALQRWDYAIHWHNGSTWAMISEDGDGNGRGLNTDGGIGDEAALFDEVKFANNAILTNRGSKKQLFEKARRFMNIVLATSTPTTQKGRWILNYENEAILKPKSVYYSRANAYMNLDNLPKDYFKNAKAIMTELLYDAEIRNIRMQALQDGFYPLLNEKIHTYSNFNVTFYEKLVDYEKKDEGIGYRINLDGIDCNGDDDLIRNEPIILGVDYGANINCLNVIQADNSHVKFLKSMYCLSPKIITDLAKQFCDYYRSHGRKEIFLYDDVYGKNHFGNSKTTIRQDFVDYLISKKWEVHICSPSQNPPMDERFVLWVKLMKGNNPKIPKLAINKHNCKELIISMQNAPAIENGDGQITKNKKSEKSKVINQSHATHLSDAADYPIHGLYSKYLNNSNIWTPEFSKIYG